MNQSGEVKDTQLRKARLAAGMLQVELASTAGISPSRLNTIERGWGLPTLPTAKKLAKALNCKVGDLFDISNLRPY